MNSEAKSAIRFRGTDSAKIIQLIQTTGPIGSGTEIDPVRRVEQYWTLEGELLFTKDDLPEISSELIERITRATGGR